MRPDRSRPATSFRRGEPIEGDLIFDGAVDGADLGILMLAWGTADPAADLDRDGIVSGAELGLLLLQWTA